MDVVHGHHLGVRRVSNYYFRHDYSHCHRYCDDLSNYDVHYYRSHYGYAAQHYCLDK